jgi:hypothetical protein
LKLLFCDRCFDIFKLGFELRSCECGWVKGMYKDNKHAVVNGKGYSLAIGNGSLVQSIRAVESRMRSEIKTDHDRYIDLGRVEYCWVRPHDGEGNPHTTIDPELGKETESCQDGVL